MKDSLFLATSLRLLAIATPIQASERSIGKSRDNGDVEFILCVLVRLAAALEIVSYYGNQGSLLLVSTITTNTTPTPTHTPDTTIATARH